MELSNLSKSVFRCKSGFSIPAVGLGTYKLNGVSGVSAMKHAIKTGYKLLDTAFIYKNETEVGQAIAESVEEGVLKSREDIFVTSKLHSGFHKPSKILPAIRHSLNLMNSEYIDLYIIHAPWGMKPTEAESGADFPFTTATDETGNDIFDDYELVDVWAQLEKAVDEGLVRHIGLSNFDDDQVRLILSNCRIKPVNNQIELHPWLDQPDSVQFLLDNDISVTSFMSLGRIERTLDSKGKTLVDEAIVLEIAKNHGKSPAQVLLRYQLQRGVLVIPKSATPSRIEENANIFDFSLSENDVLEISKLNKPLRSCHFKDRRPSKNFPKLWLSEPVYQ
ncbi:unnamed protein product [Oikopleura dioica]|uniref:NADP-dependent oxidoreductase domain-containing protein n=1 Tax=Oikopleura dioica TaxID=34765 RepID=E4YR85_OIKDI|nr:unnamed protein product [Oikopleura dioica]